jgi:ligand-binding SRPBCC domain-containing protein
LLSATGADFPVEKRGSVREVASGDAEKPMKLPCHPEHREGSVQLAGSAQILRPANGAALRMTKAGYASSSRIRAVGSLADRARLRVVLQPREPAADHARFQRHEADHPDRTPAPPPPPGTTGDKAAGVGSTIITSFRVFPFLPVRAQWIARITEFQWNDYFADVQDKGPFKSWHHRHEFRPETRKGIAGTLVRDVIDYEVGFSLLGTMANAFFVRRRMQSTFAERQQTLPKLLA